MSDDSVPLFPELADLAPPRLRWEVTCQVHRRDGGEPFVPIGVPSGGGAIACWTATKGVAVAVVEADGEMAARAAGARVCPGWKDLPGVTVEVEPRIN
jgi:hypothetical protein